MVLPFCCSSSLKSVAFNQRYTSYKTLINLTFVNDHDLTFLAMDKDMDEDEEVKDQVCSQLQESFDDESLSGVSVFEFLKLEQVAASASEAELEDEKESKLADSREKEDIKGREAMRRAELRGHSITCGAKEER